MKFQQWVGALAVSASLLHAVPALAVGAATLSGKLNVDNQFNLYLSDSDTSLGTFVTSGNNWPDTYAFTQQLSGSTVYLHVVATDTGAPAAFLGEFTLSDARYAFANGTQKLLTDTANWTVRKTSFADASETPINRGTNGVSPWFLRSEVDAGAQWIWSADLCGSCTRYFSTTITAAVPEPASHVMMGMGLALVALLAQRRRWLKGAA